MKTQNQNYYGNGNLELEEAVERNLYQDAAIDIGKILTVPSAEEIESVTDNKRMGDAVIYSLLNDIDDGPDEDDDDLDDDLIDDDLIDDDELVDDDDLFDDDDLDEVEDQDAFDEPLAIEDDLNLVDDDLDDDDLDDDFKDDDYAI